MNNQFKHPDMDEFESLKKISNTNLPKTLAMWGTALFLILIVIMFVPWTQNIRSNGVVTTFNPAERPQTIHSTIAGRIEKWHIQEGQLVKKGDTIITLSEIKEKYFDPQFLTRLEEQLTAKQSSLQATQSKLAALTRQIAAQNNALQVKLNQTRNKLEQARLKVMSDSIDFEAEKVNYEVAQRQFQAQENLYKQGLKSLTELEDRKMKLQQGRAKIVSSENKLLMSKNELENLQIEIEAVEADYLDKIAKTESERSATEAYLHESRGEIAKMQVELANMEIRSSFYQVRAPKDGYVVKAIRSGTGETIKEGEAMASIIPADPELAVELYVKPLDVPLLARGSKIRLQFDGWPAFVFSGWPGVSFGTFGGVVAAIDNIDTQGKYRMLVVPDGGDETWPEQIKVGSGAYGWALLKNVPVGYELWRQLNGFPPDYVKDNIPVTAVKETSKPAEE